MKRSLLIIAVLVGFIGPGFFNIAFMQLSGMTAYGGRTILPNPLCNEPPGIQIWYIPIPFDRAVPLMLMPWSRLFMMYTPYLPGAWMKGFYESETEECIFYYGYGEIDFGSGNVIYFTGSSL